MPIYKFKCLYCDKEFDTIVKIGDEMTICSFCGNVSDRVHAQDLPAPAQIEAGVGGVYSPKFGERKYQ